MTLILAVELTADAGGLTGQLRLSKEELDKLGAQAKRAGDRAVQAGRGFDRMGNRAKAASRSLASMRNLLLATVSAETLRRVLLLADGYEAVQAQIRLATRALGDYATASRELDRIADDTGVVLGDTVAVFRAIARTAPELRATQDEVLAVTEAVQQLGAISNTAPANLRAGLLQFGQAMATQIVRGEEFNSILENIPELAERIAKGMGTTVGQLRLAVVEGKVLSSDVFRAIQSQTEEIAEDFENLPARITRSANRIRNAFGESLAGLNEQLGATEGLAGAMDQLADNMDVVVTGTLSLAAGYAAARAAALAYAAAQGAVNLVLTRSPLGVAFTLIGLAVGAYTAFALGAGRAGDAQERLNGIQEEGQRIARQLKTATGEYREALEEQRDATIEAAEAEVALAQAQIERLRATLLDPTRREALGIGAVGLGGETQIVEEDGRRVVRAISDPMAQLTAAIAEAEDGLKQAQETLAGLLRGDTGEGGTGTGNGRPPAARAVEAVETEVAKLIAGMERARATGALELGIVGLSERDQAVTRAQFEALAAAQADFNEGLRDTALLMPDEVAAVEAAAGAAFDYAQALEEIEEGQKRARSAADAMGKAAGAALLDIRNGAFSATEAVNRLIDALFQSLVIDPFASAVSDFAFGLFSPTAPATAGGSGAGGSSITVSAQHHGGLVGTGPLRTVDPAVFAGAPRFHLGGLVPGERPIIAMEGEEVLRADDPRHVRNRGGGDFIVNVFDQRSASAEPLQVSQRQVGRNEVDVLITEAVSRDIGRNGGVAKAIEGRFGIRPQGVR